MIWAFLRRFVLLKCWGAASEGACPAGQSPFWDDWDDDDECS